jgi:hypothetical protein
MAAVAFIPPAKEETEGDFSYDPNAEDSNEGAGENIPDRCPEPRENEVAGNGDDDPDFAE